MTRAGATTPCAGHRRREAAASCAVCASPICTECVVATRVGLKCPSCSGSRPAPGARRRRGRAAVLSGLGVLVAVVVASRFLDGGGAPSPGVTEDGRAAGAPLERIVQLRGAEGARIVGTLRLPARAGQGRVPGVLIIPGFGPTDRDGVNRPGGQPDHLYRDVSEELAEAGMASFRYDKRGTGQSPLPAGERLAFEDLAGDARAGVDLLAERSEVDPEALAVVGHDEGALLAMRLAASDPRVRALVLISAPGRPLVDVIADDFRATHGEASAGTLREIVAGLMATGGLPRPDSLPPEHRDFFPADQAPYLREIFSVDPAADAGAVRVPALVVHGGRATFSTAVDAARLVEALGPHGEAVVAADAGPTLARTRAAAGAGHGGEGGGGHRATATTPGRERDSAVLDRISSWLAARLLPPPR